MKISLEWLGDFLASVPQAERAADALTNGGLLVEHIETAGEDRVLDVEVGSNRGDCLSHRGVARELAALVEGSGYREKLPGAKLVETIADRLGVKIEAGDLCDQYIGRVIRGVKVGPSPGWIVRRLEAAGIRAINNIVDATNYVLMELGQPLHAFDLDRLSGGGVWIRRARRGEKIVSIDGHERVLGEEMLVIADARGPVALAGVMGGRDSEVTGATKNIFLESARFDALSVRKTGRALGMKSDSSYRFERGIDPMLPSFAADRAAALIVELGGGTAGPATAEFVGGDPRSAARKKIVLRMGQLKRIVGVEFEAGEASAALEKLGFGARVALDTVEAAVPTHRLDVTAEIDLVEEVARTVGYARVPTRAEIAVVAKPKQDDLVARDEIRRTLAGCGFFEAVTISFVADAMKDAFLPAEARGLPRADPMVRRADAHLRPSMLPGLLGALARNQAAASIDAWLFEIGAVFWLDEKGKVVERERLGIVCDDLPALRGAVEALLRRLDATRGVRVEPGERRGLRGAAGRVYWGDVAVGWIGLVDAAACAAMDIRGAVAAAELEADQLVAGMELVPQARALPKYPATERDLSLVVAESVSYAQIEAAIAGARAKNLEAVRFVTTYRGKPLEKGSKSVTVALAFRSDAGTLTGEAVDGEVARIVAAAKKELGATLRT